MTEIIIEENVAWPSIDEAATLQAPQSPTKVSVFAFTKACAFVDLPKSIPCGSKAGQRGWASLMWSDSVAKVFVGRS